MSRPAPPSRHPLGPPTLVLVFAICSVVILYYARGVLIPLAFAVILLYLVDALDDLCFRLLPTRLHPPRWLMTSLSLMVLLAAMAAFIILIADSANDVAASAAHYQLRFETVYQQEIEPRLKTFAPLDAGDFARRLEVGRVVLWLATGLASLFGKASLVVLFLFFLLIDRRFYARKMLLLFPDPERRNYADELFATVSHDIRTYLWVKTFVSLLTALSSYGIMKLVGLDFAGFWAVIIFIFNFVPNVGSLVATLLPSSLALVQFDALAPILAVGLGITAIQFSVGNLIEPHIMSKALNISAFVVVFSLIAFGILWGMAGVFLCVPFTTLLLIVCARFESTRWLAILLSRDGAVGSPPQLVSES